MEDLECEEEEQVKERAQDILRKLQDPLKPAAKEVDEHMLTVSLVVLGLR